MDLSATMIGKQPSKTTVKNQITSWDFNKVFKNLLIFFSSIDEHLHYIRDVIYRRKLHTDDVLKTMGLDRDHAPIDKT